MRWLIVTADDFGATTQVNDAVETAHRNGILTAASLMVAGPAAADAVGRAARLPELRVGLHLVLADGYSILPCAQIPALVDNTGRFGNRMFVDGLRFFALPSVRRQLEAEIRAQFAAFAASGLTLDHVNAHKHFHLHPTLLEMLVRIGRQYGLADSQVGVRVPAEPLGEGSIAGILLRPWLSLMKRRLRAAGVVHNDQIFGVADTGQMDERRLLHILSRLPQGVTEIYLHPATESHEPHGYRHADELAALMSPTVRAALDALTVSGVRCGGYRDLAQAYRQRHAA